MQTAILLSAKETLRSIASYAGLLQRGSEAAGSATSAYAGRTFSPRLHFSPFFTSLLKMAFWVTVKHHGQLLNNTLEWTKPPLPRAYVRGLSEAAGHAVEPSLWGLLSEAPQKASCFLSIWHLVFPFKSLSSFPTHWHRLFPKFHAAQKMKPGNPQIQSKEFPTGCGRPGGVGLQKQRGWAFLVIAKQDVLPSEN